MSQPAMTVKKLKSIRIPIRTVPFMMSQRFRSNCEQHKGPRCSAENLAKTKCAKDKAAGKKEVTFLQRNPECCIEPCKISTPRFDDLYYKISDKAKRQYQRTWIECPKVRYVKKPRCNFETMPDEVELKEKRCPKKGKPQTACSNNGKDGDLMKCKKAILGKCARITLPGCRGVRNPPNCFVIKPPTGCRKVCAPYPAYSECKRDPPKPLRPVSCNCLRVPSLCEVWREFNRINQGRRN